jgi:hypothetical protein
MLHYTLPEQEQVDSEGIGSSMLSNPSALLTNKLNLHCSKSWESLHLLASLRIIMATIILTEALGLPVSLEYNDSNKDSSTLKVTWVMNNMPRCFLPVEALYPIGKKEIRGAEHAYL